MSIERDTRTRFAQPRGRAFCMSSRLVVIAAALLGAAGLAGCAAAPAPEVGQALREARRAPRPSGLRLAIAPLEVAPATAAAPPAGEAWCPVPVDVKDLGDALRAAVLASGDFDAESIDVLSLPRGEGPRTVASISGALSAAAGAPAAASRTAEPIFRAPREVPLATVFAAAADKRDDLVLTLRVRRHAVRYAGHNGWYYPNVVNFLTWVWTAWLVADEEYTGEVQLDAELRSVGDERPLRTIPVAAESTQPLNAFKRGWMLTGTFTVPGWLEPQNYREAGDVVIPYARNAAAVSLTAALAGFRPTLDDPAFRGRLAQTYAVSAGAGRCTDRRLSNLYVASDDAQHFARLLSDPERGGVFEKNVTVLTEAAPTRKAFLDAVRDRASRAKAGDTLYVYFSGRGFTSARDCWLAPSDLDPSQPYATGISLTALAEAMACPAKQVAILDTSFGGEARPGAAIRSLVREPGGALETSLEAPVEPDAVRASLDAFAKGRAVLVAATPGSAATELSPVPEDKRSLLVARLADAAAGPATDVNKDGAVSLAEAFEVARREMTRLSARSGVAQVPLLLGAGGDVTISKAAKR
jgi:hypothetical protein